MKKYYTLLAFLMVAMVFATSCNKEEEEEPTFDGYRCGCGSLSWDGTNAPLLNANFIVPVDTIDYSRKYYITADLGGPDGSNDVTHNLNMEIEIMDITPAEGMQEAVLAPAQDTVEVRVEEVMISQAGTDIKRYIATEGVITIEPTFEGSTESVEFNLNLIRIVEGNTVGFAEPIQGSFTVRPGE